MSISQLHYGNPDVQTLKGLSLDQFNCVCSVLRRRDDLPTRIGFMKVHPPKYDTYTFPPISIDSRLVRKTCRGRLKVQRAA